MRTSNQGIFRISHINKDNIINEFSRVCLTQNEKMAFGSIEEIKKMKRSFDIIALIEVGDLLEITIFEEETDCSPEPISATWYIRDEVMLKNIKNQVKAGYIELDAILTHEQINNSIYRMEAD